jgi:3-phosphoglycerate kinase
MKLPDVRDFDLTGKKVLLRTDYDVPLRLVFDREAQTESAGARSGQALQVVDETRIQDSLPTINHLLSKKAKIIILSHLGRPEGKTVQELSLRPVAEKLKELLNSKLKTQNSKLHLKTKNFEAFRVNEDITLLENLRFYQGEEDNDAEFSQKVASFGDFYVNNAFACSHREHASIVGLPKLLPHAAGLDLLKEVRILSSVREEPKRPVVVILGGAKEDKLDSITGLLDWADKILIGGKLPELMQKTGDRRQETEKIIVAGLGQEGKDITLETIEKFTEIIKSAGTIVWSGPIGEYEIKDWEYGTKMMAQAICESAAFKIIGGGDTEAALTKLQLVDRIDYVSSGGGAMLEFLAKGDLPGLKSLREDVEMTG